MQGDPQLYVTKNATFDARKIQTRQELLNHFENIRVSEPLQQLLQGQGEWEMQGTIDDELNIEREAVLECMVTNHCTSINLQHYWDKEIPLLLHIEFKNLKALVFSVDSDQGYMSSIEFLTKLDAPNLVILDLSNMEDGGYSLRPLRKCCFPRLQVINLEFHCGPFKDYQACTEGYFPLLKEFKQQYCDPVRKSNFWRAKMQSPAIRPSFTNTYH